MKFIKPLVYAFVLIAALAVAEHHSTPPTFAAGSSGSGHDSGGSHEEGGCGGGCGGGDEGGSKGGAHKGGRETGQQGHSRSDHGVEDEVFHGKKGRRWSDDWPGASHQEEGEDHEHEGGNTQE